MKTIKTSKLTGDALNWAAGLAKGLELSLYGVDPSIRARVPGLGVLAPWKPVFNWTHCGFIMDDLPGLETKTWLESNPDCRAEAHIHNYDGGWVAFGPNLRVAVLRCFVEWKLGPEVEVPDALLP